MDPAYLVYMLFRDRLTSVSSRDAQMMRQAYKDLDRGTYELLQVGRTWTIRVRPGHEAHHADIARRVSRHLARFPD
jgi:hypothetical protein